MTTFVKFDKDGNILSTCRLEFIPQGLQHPSIDLAENESVIEAEPADAFAAMSCLDMHNNYKVDVSKGKLVSKAKLVSKTDRDQQSRVAPEPRR